MNGIVFDCDGVLVDSEKLSCGIAAARAAGMVALGFSSGATPEALRSAGADHVFGDYSALGTLVDSFWPVH